MDKENDMSFDLYKSPGFQKIISDAYKLNTLRLDSEVYGLSTLYSSRFFFNRSFFNQPFQVPSVDLNHPEEAHHHFENLIQLSKQLKTNIVIKSIANISTNQRVSNSLISVLPLWKYSTYSCYIDSRSPKLRQNIRTYKNKLRNTGFRIELSKSEADLKTFYTLMCDLYTKKHRMVFQPYNMFKTILDQDYSELLVAKDDKNRVQAGILVLSDRTTAHYSWAASSLEHRQFALNTLLIDFAIQRSFDEKHSHFDFGCTSENDDNLLLFKKKWGTEEFNFYNYYTLRQPSPPNLNSSYTSLRKIYATIPCLILKPLMNYAIPMFVH